jgi:hypothetical protein
VVAVAAARQGDQETGVNWVGAASVADALAALGPNVNATPFAPDRVLALIAGAAI